MIKGEIWLVEFPQYKNGHEQHGSRPAIILADTSTNVSIAIPLTANLQTIKYADTIEIKSSSINGLKENSVALIFQIRAIDKKRLVRKIGNLEASKLSEIDKLLRELLRL